MSKSNLPVLLLKNLVLLPLEEARIELNNDVTKKIIDISKTILRIAFIFILLYNYWVIYLFDEEFAKVKKINVRLIRIIVYLILPIGIIVLTRVVGIILTIALMTIPSSLAKLFFNSFAFLP